MAAAHQHTADIMKVADGSSEDVSDTSIAGYHAVFHTGHMEVLLFPSLVISTQGHLAGACVVIFLIAVLYEGLRLFISWLQIYINTQPQRCQKRVWLLGVAQSLSYMVHLLVGYCLMLIFMMLNVWLCLSVLLGAGSGFMLFHFRPAKSRFFGLLSKNNREEADVAKSETTTVGYEQMEEFNMNDANARK